MTETSFDTAVKLLMMNAHNKSAVDYGKMMYGFSRSTVYMLIKTARKFIEYDVNQKCYRSIFNTGEHDYKLSQLIELNALDVKTAIQLHEQRIISPDMNAKKIREAVKTISL